MVVQKKGFSRPRLMAGRAWHTAGWLGLTLMTPSILLAQQANQVSPAPLVNQASITPQEVKQAAPAQNRGVSILEGMQNEVASIAAQARSCIVTIEDPRALIIQYYTSSLRKTDLQEQIAHLAIDKKAIDALVEVRQKQVTTGAITSIEVQKSVHEQSLINARLTALQHRLANFGNASVLTQQTEDVNARIAELEIDQKFYAEQVKMTQLQVNAGIAQISELSEIKRQLAHTELDLNIQRSQRKNFEGLGVVMMYRENQQRLQYVLPHESAPKSGSGFSIGEGYIVTTADVVHGMTNPLITTDDGRQLRAALIATDTELNIGLLRMTTAAALPALKLGDSATVVPGHFAIAIGNQAGQTNSVALAMISGLRLQGLTSSTHFYPNLLQIDGTVGAGNSGAPVLNVRGEVIGMVAATLANDSSATSYATPVNGDIYNSAAYQSRQRLSLGNNAAAPSTTATAQKNINGNAGNEARSLQLQAGQRNTQNTPATRGNTSDLRTSNNISAAEASVNQTPLRSLVTSAGTTESVPFERFFPQPHPALPSGNTGFAIPVNGFKNIIEDLKSGKNIVHAWLGLDLEDIDNAHEENGIVRLGRQVRVRSMFADSAAVKSGEIQVGDILLQLNGKPVLTVNEVRTAILVMMKPGQKVEIELQRNAQMKRITLTTEPRPAIIPARRSFTGE